MWCNTQKPRNVPALEVWNFAQACGTNGGDSFVTAGGSPSVRTKAKSLYDIFENPSKAGADEEERLNPLEASIVLLQGRANTLVGRSTGEVEGRFDEI
jgi:hypothetical protein